MLLFGTHERRRIVDHLLHEVRDVFRNNPGLRVPTVITPLMEWTWREKKYSPIVLLNHEQTPAACGPER